MPTPQPIVLQTQGSFAAGGVVITGANGDTAHVDHAYVQYQIPVGARRLPLVMWHGGGQFSKTWETTPDGRDGYQNIFLRRGFSTYILDQPRRGRGGRSALGTVLPDAAPVTALLFNVFRLGVWTPPDPARFFPGVQFPQGEADLDQYWRQQSPNAGPEDRDEPTRAVMANAGAALFDRIGPAVLLTHSNSGQYGWLTRIRSPQVQAIVSYEPGSFVFPADDLPPSVATEDGLAAALSRPIAVAPSDFAKLTEIPIQIVYGDNIETATPSPITGVELWRVNLQRAVQFRDAVNRRGGQVEILHLPKAGLQGNTHFPFSDLNNLAVADLLSAYLEQHGLDRR